MKTRTNSYSWFVISRNVLGTREYWNRFRKQWTTRSNASRWGTIDSLLAYLAKGDDRNNLVAQNLSVVKLTSTTTQRTVVSSRVTSQRVR